jgi:hypothetical protein
MLWTMLPVKAPGGADGNWCVISIVGAAVMYASGIMLVSCIIGGGDGAVKASAHMVGAGGSGSGVYRQ